MIKASYLLQLGKEVQDVIQAWVDPEMTKGKLAEAQDLAPHLWNLGEQFPEIKTHLKEFMLWVAAGAQLETMKEYFAGDFVEWDLEVFGETG